MLVDFALERIPGDGYWQAESLYYREPSSPEFKSALDKVFERSVDEAYRIAVELYESRRYARSKAIFETFVEKRPTWATCAAYLAMCCERLGERERAKNAYLKAFLIDPKKSIISKILQRFYHSIAPIISHP